VQKDACLPADPALALQDAKRLLRRTARAARAAAAAADSAAGGLAAAALRDRVLAAVDPAPGTVAAAYWPLGDEIDPRPLMAALHERGLRLALPAIRAAGQPLDFRAWRPGDALQAGGFGTQEPAATAPSVAPSVLLVPLLAFDAAGYRLGYGGGFYDRSLARLRAPGDAGGDTLAVGLAYADQQVAAVPREATDQPLDLVVTERDVIVPAAVDRD
jgi:5-formyltetrahydrofolate cyclo-ligase